MSVSRVKLLIHSAQQVVTFQSTDSVEFDKLTVLQKTGANGCAVAIDYAGRIAAVGYDDELKPVYSDKCEKNFDASGLCIIPGLVDGHTHPVWAGDRVHEFAMKLAGASYMDIHQAGGGINYTVEQTRQATHDQLYKTFVDRINTLMKSGVTLVECKSGYGLDFDTELKMLEVINRAINDPEVKVDISVTYCGAHSVPKGSTADQATLDIVNNQIPKLRELCQNDQLKIDNFDVFCEKGVFDVPQTRKMLEAGREAGWNLNFHAEELNCLNSAEMGAELNALAMSHLEEVSDAAIKLMADRGCFAVILPTTAYLLHLTPPPVRKMLDAGVRVALGTDFNPNAYCLSMPLVMNLACVTLKMTMAEALAAATINGAGSLNKSDTHGSIQVGKWADLVFIDAPSWEHLVYQLGNSQAIIKHVLKSGEFVYNRDQ